MGQKNYAGPVYPPEQKASSSMTILDDVNERMSLESFERGDVKAKEFAARIMKEAHASVQRLHDAGFLDAATMREFDALCMPQAAREEDGTHETASVDPFGHKSRESLADDFYEPGRRRYEIGGPRVDGGSWDDLGPWAKAYWTEVARLEGGGQPAN